MDTEIVCVIEGVYALRHAEKGDFWGRGGILIARDGGAERIGRFGESHGP